MKKKTFTLLLLLTSVVMFSFAQKKTDLSMFPKAADGQKRIVIQLKTFPNESNYKIELIAGKTAEIDKCNTFFLAGNIEEKMLDGWGYTYYNFNTTGSIGGTKMFCMEDRKIKKFLKSPSITINYNSKMPVVVYLPSDCEVHYKIWKTDNNEIKPTAIQ